MVIPWVGFPLGDLMKWRACRTVREIRALQDRLRPGQMPGQR